MEEAEAAGAEAPMLPGLLYEADAVRVEVDTRTGEVRRAVGPEPPRG